MSKYDGQPEITVRCAEDVWFRAYCRTCNKDCEGIETLDKIGKADSALKPRCDCAGVDGCQLGEVERGAA